MAELIDAVIKIARNQRLSETLTELVRGTVSKIEPLEIIINDEMPPVREELLILTETVMEKKIRVTKHSHRYNNDGVLEHTHTFTGNPHDHNFTGNTHSHPLSGNANVSVNVTVDGKSGSGSGSGSISGTATSVTASGSLNDVTQGGTNSDALTGVYNTTEETIEMLAFLMGKQLEAEEDEDYLWVTITRGLKVGDKCTMLSVMNGQNFIVLSREYDLNNLVV